MITINLKKHRFIEADVRNVSLKELKERRTLGFKAIHPGDWLDALLRAVKVLGWDTWNIKYTLGNTYGTGGDFVGSLDFATPAGDLPKDLPPQLTSRTLAWELKNGDMRRPRFYLGGRFEAGGCLGFEKVLHTRAADELGGAVESALRSVEGSIENFDKTANKFANTPLHIADRAFLSTFIGRAGFLPWSRLKVVDYFCKEVEHESLWLFLEAAAKANALSTPLNQPHQAYGAWVASLSWLLYKEAYGDRPDKKDWQQFIDQEPEAEPKKDSEETVA